MSLAVLNPAGSIALQEKNLLIMVTVLMLIIVVPVVIMVFVFAWKYRASNTKAKYSPNWCHSNVLEAIWWGIPSVLIVILAIITWVSTQKLDPYRKLEHKADPVEIQVVALDWKWLFLYPEYNIATVNYIKIPLNRPINFSVTADAPMNSFMIPRLGGQIYAMQGMETKIHLIAEEIGEFDGYSANYSGHGFSGMNFKAVSASEEEFQNWVVNIKNNGNVLTKQYYYDNLIPPTKSHPVELFASTEKGLYRHIIDKYLMSHSGMNHAHHHKKAEYSTDQHIRDVGHVSEYYKNISHH
ncbi:MAG: cytochrome o ubiquinol oxidase subunit 2 [Candidatus Deianiraeaceae bacterium]|jgi:cytochrome o ubiquinol oxidase subunit 2